MHKFSTAALVALAVALPAIGQESACADRVPNSTERGMAAATSVETAIQLALLNDLRRDTAQARIAAARTEIGIATLRPEDQIGFQAEEFPRSDQLDTLDSLEVTASFSRTWERGGKRAAREALASRRVNVSEAMAVETDAEIEFEVRRLYAAILVANARAAAECQQIAYLSELQTITNERVRRSIDPEIAAARIATGLELARADGARFDAQSQSYTNQLADYIQKPDIIIDHTALRDVHNIRAIDLGFSALPTLMTLDERQREARAKIVLEETEQIADITWNVGVRSYGFADEIGIVSGLTIPIGTGARSNAKAARARAEETALEVQKRALLQQVVRDANAIHQSSKRASRALQNLDATLIPQAEHALELAQTGYQRGALPFRDILDAHDLLIALQKQRVDHIETLLINDASLARLSGNTSLSETIQ